MKKKSQFQYKKGFISLFFLMLAVFFMSFTVRAASVVKIGWYDSTLFQGGMSDTEKKSGYSYEYIHKISDYNGWNYEYVYGGWSDLLSKLETGEIDVLAGVSITDERKTTIAFPDYEMGNENYCLYQKEGGTMTAAKPSTISGKRIGVIKDNLMTDYLDKWMTENGITYIPVIYEDFNSRDTDFKDGKLDAIVSTDNNTISDAGYEEVVEVGSEPYYLAVNKERTDLLAELNSALKSINTNEPYFLQNLLYESYGTSVRNASLTAIEKEWVKNHSTLKIGYLEDYLPYCKTDEDGNVTGLIKDVVLAMKEKLKMTDITVTYEAYDNYSDMIGALKSGTLDSAFPVGGGTWYLEQDGIRSSKAVVNAGMTMVYKGAHDDSNGKKIAVNKNNNLQYYYVMNNYPDATIVECTSITECLDKVKSGEASSTILNGLRTNLVSANSDYKDLSILQLANTDERAFGVAEGNTGLLMLFNRGLNLIGENYGVNASYNYLDELYSYTTSDFIADNYVLLLVLSALVIVSIVLLFFLYARKARKTDHEMEKNLSEIKKLNTELAIEKNKADAASQAKTSFLFNMSHDIRTPMNAIMGFTDLLEKHQDDPEKREDYLNKIRDSSTVLLSIINNVLEMARIEKGTIEVDEKAWDATEYNESIVSAFTDMMKEKKIEFKSVVHVDHPYVYIDPTKLREVFFNILSNAYKYTNPGGKVTMELNEISSEKEGYVTYRTEITDNGIGMSEEFIPHIFEEFSREHNTTETKIEGTGLGMPIVKRLVDFMGGTITIRSVKGKGTNVTVILSHRLAHAEEINDHEKKVTVEPITFSGKRILLAEDNDMNAEIAMEILKESGFNVERAENGKICLDMLEKKPAGYYDVILMDIQMPVMNGYEATEAIRNLPDKVKSNIRIVAMTANVFESDKKKSKEAGMDAHLAKPIEVEELMKVLSIMLE